ncbi:MAG: hypothetical protein J6T65_07575 [Clostridia bacterium]|nr:hypothetical protein [Clostridia bacterium]
MQLIACKKEYAVEAAFTILLILLTVLSAVLTGCGSKTPVLFKDTLPDAVPDPDEHVQISAAGEPEIIYAPPVDVSGYRYGPSIIYYADGSCDAWFSTNGYNGEWDWITYRHSRDGVHFDTEKVVLVPTPDSMDRYSCCDPGVIYFGGWYYLGYTSTIVEGGVSNNVFVARSKDPAGPYEKWNGSGWGGDPAPVIYYDEGDSFYGAGEPSMTVVNGVLYFYYTWCCPDRDCVRVATSDTSEDWPAKLTYRGEACVKTDGQDSCDVAYLEDAGKFVGFTTRNGHSADSRIVILESDDGINFREAQSLTRGLFMHMHSLGVSKRPDGHIQLKDPLFVGYAFSDGAGNNWGKWATAIQKVSLGLYKGPVRESESGGSIRKEGYLKERDPDPPAIGIAPYEKIVELYKDVEEYEIYFVWLDPMLASHEITNYKKLRYSGYDASLITVKDNKIYTKGNTGETCVTVRYGSFENSFKVYIRGDYSEFRGDFKKTVKEFTPMVSEYTLKLSDEHRRQIRGMARFSDNTWAEATNEGKMISLKKFPVTYEVSAPSVISVDGHGIIIPLAAGIAEVKVTIAGELSFSVKVKVEE